MTSKRSNKRYGLPLGLLVLCSAGPLHAQEGGGRTLTYGIDSRITSHDNLDLNANNARNSVLSDTSLSFGIRNETPSGFLALSSSVLLRETISGSSDTKTGLINPAVNLSFGTSTVNSGIQGGVFLRDTELSSNDDVEDFDNDAGRRRSYGGDLSLHWGSDSRATYRVGISSNASRFSSDANENDRDSLSMNAGVGLDLTEIATLDLGVSSSRFDEDGEEERTTNRLTTGLSFLQTSGSLGVSLGLTDTPDGNRTALSVTRSIELTNGSIEARLGITRGISGKNDPTGGLTYSHSLPNGSFSARFNHDVSSSSTSDREAKLTSAGMGISQEWSERSTISMDINYAKQDYSDSDSDIINTRASLSISYALGEDWLADAGLRHVQRDRGDTTASDNSVFIGIRKSFERSY